MALFLALPLAAQESPFVRDNADLLAARGDGEVTLEDFQARVDRIPPEQRFVTVRNRTRFEDMLNKLLIDAQLAADAKADGFHENPVVRARLELAMREELARAWIEHKVDDGGAVDYTAMAREEWMLNRDKYVTPETIDVAHILISTENRTPEEALMLASTLHDQLRESPENFSELAKANSDDPGSASRGGTYPGVKRGDMVKPFEDAAFALDVGEISDPVLTDYGYHLIKVDGKTSPEQKSFDAVRLQLENQAREQYRERKRREYLQPLYAEEMEVTRESVENAVERALGPDVLARNAQEEADR